MMKRMKLKVTKSRLNLTMSTKRRGPMWLAINPLGLRTQENEEDISTVKMAAAKENYQQNYTVGFW